MRFPIFNRDSFYLPIHDNENFSKVYSINLESIQMPENPYALKSIGYSTKSHDLVGRIINKSKIFWYSLRDEKEDVKLPIWFEISVHDGKTAVSVTIWNELAIQV